MLSMKAVRTVGIREFRQELSDYLRSSEPVAVTRHGHTLGVFIPTDPKGLRASLQAFKEASSKLDKLLASQGLTGDDVLDELESKRR
jgi:antitoxin (DNA-binding transcriptional repressor) of toxin-antitoxin stability system